MKRKIAVVTSSRADYAHLRWLLHDLARHPAVELQVIAMGPHLSPAFGHTGNEIAGSGFPRPSKVTRGGGAANFTSVECLLDSDTDVRPSKGTKGGAANFTSIECLLDSDTDVGMAKTIGVATLGLADALSRLRPDILLIIADRYEMLAPASVALALRIPIAHVEGGEITFGAIDDAVRNALTKMGHLHFACTRKAAERIASMGEERWRITFSGSLSLDHLRRERLLSKAQVETKLDVKLRRDTVLCIYHPVTLFENTLDEADEVFAALGGLTQPAIFIYPNADAGCRELIRRAEEFAASGASSRVFVNMDHRTYLSLLNNVGVLVGNSSSGIIESTSLEVPVVNVGIRQLGREHAANVIDVPAKRKAIRDAIARALSPAFRRSISGLESPYGDGGASKIICDVLLKTAMGEKLLFKHAHDFAMGK